MSYIGALLVHVFTRPTYNQQSPCEVVGESVQLVAIFIYTAALPFVEAGGCGSETRDGNKIRGLFEDCCAGSCVLGSQQGCGVQGL